MDYASRKKLFAAGYTLLRADDHPTPRLKACHLDALNWSIWKKFDTKAARDREIVRIGLEEPLIIFE
jgi:hypothetical protein